MEKDFNSKIMKRQKRVFSDVGDVQNRQVDARMLQIDWIFAENGGKEKVGFAEFVVALSKAPHESVFSTDLIKTLVDHFWARYYRAVVNFGFLPFMIYMILTLIYVSNYTV